MRFKYFLLLRYKLFGISSVFITLFGRFLSVKISIRSFANIRDALGSRIIDLEVPEGSDIQSLLKKLCEQYPQARGLIFEEGNLRNSLKIALDLENIRDLSIPLRDGQQVALIPPTGG